MTCSHDAAPNKSPTRLLPCFVALVLTFLAQSLAAAPARSKQAAAKGGLPNVVLIVADDLGWADLGCYGSTYHRTPALDRLARKGVRFTNAYSASPVCSPTRAALLTGCYPSRLNITDWLPGRADRPDQQLLRPRLAAGLPQSSETLAEVLAANGYVTGSIGKWHLGGGDLAPTEQGFGISVGGDQNGSPLSYFAPFKANDGKGQVQFMPGLNEARDGEYLTDRLAREAESFIKSNRDKPFFLYLPHYAVHIPLRAKKEISDTYAQTNVPGRQSNPVYAAMLQSLDEAVGVVIAAIEATGVADNTIIMFTSDNGGLATLEGGPTPVTINSPLREGKGFLYEGGIRVPLIVHWPATSKAGDVCEVPVISMDLFSTICDACKAANPSGRDGESFRAQLAGNKEPLHDALYWHYPHYSNQGGKPSGAIREGNLKLIEFFENDRRELFDLAADISESRNLADERPQEVQRLAEKLAAWRKEKNAAMPTANAGFRPNPPSANGTIELHARTAHVHGSMLRYEPLPHKDTLGFWVNAEDYATFEFTVTTPGSFELVALQGCGGGHGGSEVEYSVGEQKKVVVVDDTGGFQNFQPKEVGTFTFDSPQRYTLAVRALHKAKGAVMDLRSLEFRPLEVK